MLRIEAFSLHYRSAAGPVGALADVSLRVAPGRTLAVVGESGSGKSTLALAVMGLLPAEAVVESGRILFGGTDLLALPAQARRRLRGARMALVFQDPFSVLNPTLRVGLQIGEAAVWHRGLTRAAAARRAVDLLAEVGIADPPAVARAYPHELSGGMRQRALIAGALAGEPDLLILDEPTTALDVTIEAQILDVLADLQARRGLAMLFITHNLGVVRRVADDVAVLYAGEVVEQSPASQLFAAPRHPYTKGLLAALPGGAGDKRLAAIAGRLPDLRTTPAGCRFLPRCPLADAACAQPQPLVDGVRCHRAGAFAGRPWPVEREDAPPRRPVGTAIAEAEGLTKTYVLTSGFAALRLDGWRPVLRPRGLRALDGVSITIAAGETLGLVGESGSGKTTLGRTLLRLIDPDAGRIRIAGQDISTTPQAALATMRRRAQIVFQNPDSSLNPRHTVGEIIARPLRRFAVVPAAQIAARVAALLDLVRLPGHYAARYPHQLSGGEKQRVGIARALAPGPDLMVCDEPVSALDVSVQAAIVNLLADLRDRLGLAVLLISHDIGVVAHLADRIAVMYRGGIVQTGTAGEVMGGPWHPYTAALLSAVPSLDGQARPRVRLGPEGPARDGPGCRFAARCPRRIGALCETTAPPLRRLSATNAVACHLDRTQLPTS